MTYAEFEDAVIEQVFPESEEAENLRGNHSAYILDAVIKIQQRVKYWQQHHFEYVPYSSTFWNCGGSAFSAPRGFIKSLRVIENDDECTKVIYTPVTPEAMACLMVAPQACNCAMDVPSGTYYTEAYGDVDYPDVGQGFMYPDATTDKPCRALDGSFTLQDCMIYIWPHIQSNETAILEWSGLKRLFAADDEVTFDREFQEAVEDYVRSRSAALQDKEEDYSKARLADFNNKIGDMIFQHLEETTLPQAGTCFNNCT